LLKTNKDLKKYKIPVAYRLRVIVLQNYGIMLQNEGRENEAMNIMISEVIPLALKSKDDEITSHVYKAISVILMNAEEYKKADYYINQAQFYVQRSTKISPTLSESKVETYILNAENLIELKKFDLAQKTLAKADAMVSKYPESKFNNTFYFANGLYFDKLNQFNKAIQNFNIAIKSCQLSKDLLSLNRLKTGKYEVLLKQKKYNEAIIIIENLIKTDVFPDNVKNHYKSLAKANKQIGNWEKAYNDSEKYITLNDSSNANKFRDQIVTLDAKFNKTQNEKKINQLLAQKEKATLVSKNDRLNMLLLALLASILLVSIFIIWKYFKNQKKQKEIDFKHEIAALENKKNLDVSNALLQGEEIERKRLARDLHDGLGSMLSGIKLYYSATEHPNQNEFVEVNNQLDNSIKELRQIAQNLMPESLLKLGLVAALKDLCFRFSNDKTFIEFQEFGIQNNISETKQITIYRIIQELINNALKYANATEILVNCSQNQTTFLITVEDNGAGFDTKKANLFGGMGLKNIKNRVDFLKGELEIDSQPENGTVFNIELNVSEEQKTLKNA
jgi:two-component system, NarL family, sensor kinase